MIRVRRPSALPPATDRFVVVDASAGTGKTFFLEHRVADLVIAGGAELPQILVVTFTDKAVAELRARIRDLLDRLARATTDTAAPDEPAWELDDDARARLRAAVSAFDRAPIHTIHGFCHRVLVEDAFAARRLFDQTQVADEVAFDAAFAAVLRERFARVEPDRGLLAAYLAGDGHTVDTLRELLLACARTGAPPRRSFDAAAIVATAAPIVAAFAAADARARLHRDIAWTGQGKRHGGEWLDAVAAALDRHRATAVDASSPARLLAALDDCRDKLANLRKQLATKHAALGAAIDAAIELMPLGEAIAIELLPHVVARVDADKTARGLFDYDDMLALVDAALQGPRGDELAARLRARTPWVMIDEFQDTDPRQWRIFRTAWMHGDTRGLAIVGDPKQAIYAFRGADVATYLAARDDLRRIGATEVALDVNRRSTPQLVAAVNHVLAGSPLMPLMQGDIRYDRAAVASGDVTADAARALTILALRGSSTSADAQKLALAAAIGEHVEALRAAPPAWRGRGGDAPAFSLAHVMVLTERNAESAELAAALRRRGLPCAVVESEQLFATREAAELAAVLAAVAAPRDRAARLRALRTRFFDVAWRDLAACVDAPDHHPAIARLYDWANLAARRAYEPLFRRLVEDSRFAERALVVGGGERAVVNTWHLIELLLVEVARSRCDASELAAQLRGWIADGRDRIDDLDVQRADTDADAVRVLTVHKAKGLEAPYVFFYGGLSKPPNVRAHALRDAAGRRLVVSPRDDVKAMLDDQRTGETERLAYVALTRAQVRLFLPHYSDVKDHAMYRCVQRCVAPLALGRASHANVDVVAVDVGGEEVAPAPADALAGFEAPPPPVVAEPAAVTGARAGVLALSYTRLAHDLDRATLRGAGQDVGASQLAVEPAEDARDDGDLGDLGAQRPLAVDRLSTSLRDAARAGGAGAFDADDLPPGIASGVFLHHVLEHADVAVARGSDAAAWGARRDIRALLADAGARTGVVPRYFAHGARLAHRALTAPIALRGGGELPALADAGALAREVEFAFPMATAAAPLRGLVKGFIDALALWGDELWVVDYKSDAIGGDAAVAADRVDRRYMVQARLYALAAARLAAAGRGRLAGVAFLFLRDHVAVPVRVDDGQLAAWTAWLGGLA